MNFPNDPFMLMSIVNTKLRDFYPSLDEFCKVEDADKDELIEKLKAVGFEYDEKLNKFC